MKTVLRPLACVPLLGGMALALLLSGCGPGEQSTTAPKKPAAPTKPAVPAGKPAPPGSAGISEAARQEARQIFSTRCYTCHGAEGRGDGPASKGLQPPPRNFHDPAWQASVSDEHIERIILYGGAAVGKSAAMPANPDLNGKPEVVAALVEHIRGLGNR